RDACAADERAPGLEGEARARQPLGDDARERPDELGDRRRVLVAVVADAEPAADVDERGPPPPLLAEGDDALDRRGALVDARELRADVHVHADELETALARTVERDSGALERQAELRARMRRLDRPVRVGLD